MMKRWSIFFSIDEKIAIFSVDQLSSKYHSKSAKLADFLDILMEIQCKPVVFICNPIVLGEN